MTQSAYLSAWKRINRCIAASQDLTDHSTMHVDEGMDGPRSNASDTDCPSSLKPVLTSNESAREIVDSGVFGIGRRDSVDSRAVSFKFRSLSYEIVRHWSHCSFASSNFLSISLQDIPSLDRRSSSWLVGMNIQSMILGTSVLSYPFAFMHAGIWAVPFVIIIGIAASISAGLLQDCLYQNSRKLARVKRVRRTYVEVCKAAWPVYGQAMTECIVFLGLLRNVIVLTLLTNLSLEVLQKFIHFDRGVVTVIWAVITLPLLFIKRVSSLGWISFIGLLLYLAGFLTILVHCLLLYESWDFNNLHLSFKVEGVGLAAGIIINSFSQHLSFPPVEGSMKKPKQFRNTLNVSIIVNIILKLSLGVSAVMVYGVDTGQSITANLPDRRMTVPSDIAIAFFAYFTLPMQSFVIFDLIDSKFHPYFPVCATPSSWAWLLVSRSLVLTFCLLIAILVPHFGLLVSFIGSIRGSLVSLVLPPIFYLTLFKHKIGLMKKVTCFAVAAIGVLFGTLGIYSSTNAVVKACLH